MEFNAEAGHSPGLLQDCRSDAEAETTAAADCRRGQARADAVRLPGTVSESHTVAAVMDPGVILLPPRFSVEFIKYQVCLNLLACGYLVIWWAPLLSVVNNLINHREAELAEKRY